MKDALYFLGFGTVFLLGLVPPAANAQSASDVRAEVLGVIHRLFDGMREGDSTAVRAVFDAGARMQSVGRQDGTPVLRTGSVDRFVAAVGRPHEAVWDERIWDPVVHLDGPMATVWTPYAFYQGNRLSHCGVNAFQLIRRGDGWKIFSLVDTRRQEECEIPDEVRR